MEYIKHIDSGCFGSVDLYSSKECGLVAVKTFFRHVEESHLKEFETAKKLWECSNSDFLRPFEIFEKDGHLCIVTEYFESSAFCPNKITQKEKVAKKLCRIFSALNKEKVFYSDLNNRNLLIGKDDEIFLVDFDCPSTDETDYYEGEMWVDPPEFVKDGKLSKEEAEKYQIWRLGLLLLQVFSGLDSIDEIPENCAGNSFLRATLDPNPETRYIPQE
ncbi:putative serine/threonine protein kinase [Brazilian marseillevirus]|uniref:putative serine/threonine protein kinase n=1 Tax=Brazilian marseillevirus TaxID=1813599 RepID=UPI000786303E|nr:putative serine/threonine protein kinase [Brazilian marseillevirus]AMQ10614.1 putative serine/threonine protein kinase [Brazilian marseillevirus]